MGVNRSAREPRTSIAVAVLAAYVRKWPKDSLHSLSCSRRRPCMERVWRWPFLRPLTTWWICEQGIRRQVRTWVMLTGRSTCTLHAVAHLSRASTEHSLLLRHHAQRGILHLNLL